MGDVQFNDQIHDNRYIFLCTVFLDIFEFRSFSLKFT